MGIITICVSECIGEFSQQFPVPNAMVEYVRTFVDEELGWVIGLAYWYAFVSVFAVENLAAAELSHYWNLSQTFQTLAFYVASPIIVLLLNLFGVFVRLVKPLMEG
jgi:yeast amino acid transporter